MSNYVANRVLCSAEVYHECFNPCGSEEKPDRPHVTFDKIWDEMDDPEERESWEKYEDEPYEEYPCGCMLTTYVVYSEHGEEEEWVDIRFLTRRHYPIYTILRLAAMKRKFEWYFVEDNIIYVTHFVSDGQSLNEEIYLLENDPRFDLFFKENFSRELEEDDDIIWYYGLENRPGWIKIVDKNPAPRYNGSCYECRTPALDEQAPRWHMWYIPRELTGESQTEETEKPSEEEA